MKGSDIRKAFLDFFSAQGGPATGGAHTIVPSSSLLPDDPSVLLTTAGMQQFKPYYTGAADAMHDFKSLNTASSQKCFRTSDIDEVGDDTHLTFFEMLGNFSFGGYLKEGAITFAHKFITRELGLEISYVTIFEGSHGVPKDDESRAAWQALGIKDIREEGINDVFWGPTGTSGPCGPTTEIYCKNANGKDVEVWNLVFNEYFYPGTRDELLGSSTSKSLERLKTPGVDTGMGLERLVMIVQKKRNLFETDLFAPFLELVPQEPGERVRRVIVDHIRGSAFLIADGVRPSNKEAGYILRRLLRRVFAYEELYKMPIHIVDALLHDIVHEYGETYKDLGAKADTIRAEVTAERERFVRTLKSGMKEMEKLLVINATSAFNLYQSFGISYEIIKDVAKEKAAGLLRKDFEVELERHQEKSRQGAEKKFGGHGLILDTGELKAKDAKELQKVTRLHSATHLLQASLRKVLGAEVHQMGSDITVERTRFDFAFGRKVTPEELKAVEDIVNGAIEKDYIVTKKLLPFDEAVKTGALYFFKEKYPETVNVYTFGGPDESEVFSREFCGGPHVTHTREIGKFRILKEEASSAGVRRIRATIEP